MIRLRVRTGLSFESRGEYRVGWLKRSHRSHCCAKTAPTGDKYFSDKVSVLKFKSLVQLASLSVTYSVPTQFWFG